MEATIILMLNIQNDVVESVPKAYKSTPILRHPGPQRHEFEGLGRSRLELSFVISRAELNPQKAPL